MSVTSAATTSAASSGSDLVLSCEWRDRPSRFADAERCSYIQALAERLGQLVESGLTVAAVTYILTVLAPNTGASRFHERHGLAVEHEADALSHYRANMGFVAPATPPVPAQIMRYRC